MSTPTGGFGAPRRCCAPCCGADGAVFMVYLDSTLSLYRRTGGAGTLLGSFGVSQVEELLQQALDAVASVEAMAPQKDSFVADGTRNWFDIPGLYYDAAYLDVTIGDDLQPPSRYNRAFGKVIELDERIQLVSAAQ